MTETEVDKSGRVLYIYTRLLQGQTLKKREVAEIFGVNVRSIQRDLELIRDFLDREREERGIRNRLVYDYQKRGYRLVTEE